MNPFLLSPSEGSGLGLWGELSTERRTQNFLICYVLQGTGASSSLLPTHTHTLAPFSTLASPTTCINVHTLYTHAHVLTVFSLKHFPSLQEGQETSRLYWKETFPGVHQPISALHLRRWFGGSVRSRCSLKREPFSVKGQQRMCSGKGKGKESSQKFDAGMEGTTFFVVLSCLEWLCW